MGTAGEAFFKWLSIITCRIVLFLARGNIVIGARSFIFN